MQGIMSVMGIFINTILYHFSSTAVAIYGIMLKVQNLAQICVHGMNNALIPIIAYNYGAKEGGENPGDGAVCFPVCCGDHDRGADRPGVYAKADTDAFDASENMLTLGIPAIRFMSISFYISSVGIIFAAIFRVWKWKIQHVPGVYATGNLPDSIASGGVLYSKFEFHLACIWNCRSNGGAMRVFLYRKIQR